MHSKSSVRTERRKRIKKRIHKKVEGTSERPRLVVFRSLRGIYAQLVDDSSSKTICSVSSLSKDIKKGNKTETAKLVGKNLAEKAKTLKIEQVVFDRNGFLYHGRVKAVADGAREAGLKF